MSTIAALQPNDFRPARLERDVERPVSQMTYRRRRVVAGTLLAVVSACGIVVAHDVLAGSGGVPASAAASRPAHARPSIVARSGDTLWSIAETQRGSVSISRFVDKLVDLNGGASIQAGQRIILP